MHLFNYIGANGESSTIRNPRRIHNGYVILRNSESITPQRLVTAITIQGLQGVNR